MIKGSWGPLMTKMFLVFARILLYTFCKEELIQKYAFCKALSQSATQSLRRKRFEQSHYWDCLAFNHLTALAPNCKETLNISVRFRGTKSASFFRGYEEVRKLPQLCKPNISLHLSFSELSVLPDMIRLKHLLGNFVY